MSYSTAMSRPQTAPSSDRIYRPKCALPALPVCDDLRGKAPLVALVALLTKPVSLALKESVGQGSVTYKLEEVSQVCNRYFTTFHV